jgi:hypothetical protein
MAPKDLLSEERVRAVNQSLIKEALTFCREHSDISDFSSFLEKMGLTEIFFGEGERDLSPIIYELTQGKLQEGQQLWRWNLLQSWVNHEMDGDVTLQELLGGRVRIIDPDKNHKPQPFDHIINAIVPGERARGVHYPLLTGITQVSGLHRILDAFQDKRLNFGIGCVMHPCSDTRSTQEGEKGIVFACDGFLSPELISPELIEQFSGAVIVSSHSPMVHLKDKYLHGDHDRYFIHQIEEAQSMFEQMQRRPQPVSDTLDIQSALVLLV